LYIYFIYLTSFPIIVENCITSFFRKRKETKMALNQTTSGTQDGICPVCEVRIYPSGYVEETELLNCPDCFSLLVVDGLTGPIIQFLEAPMVEEDWGE
jgi:hypothetical protein